MIWKNIYKFEEVDIFKYLEAQIIGTAENSEEVYAGIMASRNLKLRIYR